MITYFDHRDNKNVTVRFAYGNVKVTVIYRLFLINTGYMMRI